MNKIKIFWRRFIILTCTIILLTGCDNSSMSPAVTSSTPSPVMLPPTETFALKPSLTSTSEDILVHTPLAPLTPTSPPNDVINHRCLEIANEFSPSNSVDGVLALSGDNHFLLNVQTQEIYSLPITSGSFILDYEVSPDGKWLAYVESHYDQLDQLLDKQLRVVMPDGQLLKAFHLPDDWFEMSWLNNEWLLFEHSGRPSGAVTLLNPFTGKNEEYLASLSGAYDIYRTHPVPAWSTVYNSTLSHVAYISDMGSDGYSNAVLWDLISNKAVGRINHWSNENVPKWSPDGKQLAIVAYGVDQFRDEIFILSQDGQETQLTNLAATYPIVFIETLNWSPDGRFIAFLMEGRQSYDEPGPKRLMILDVLEKQVTDFCLGNVASLPYWSPDGQQFILNKPSESEPNSIILVDIVQAYAVQIADQVSVNGWLASPTTTESHLPETPPTQVSISPTPYQGGQVHQQCLAIGTDFSTERIVDGTIVFNRDLQLKGLTSQTENIHPLLGFPAMAPVRYPRGYISPNGKWLVYEYRKESYENFLFLTTADGKQQLSIPWSLEQRQEMLLGWLDNERLVFLSGFEDSIILYSPFTSQQEDGTFSYNFSSPYDDIENQYPWDECYHCQASLWPNPLSMIHEPTLTRLAYLSSPGMNNEPPSVVLKDLANGLELWRLSHWDTFQHYPKWSFDGEQMAIALPTDKEGNHYELLSVDQSGQSVQLTNLAYSYPVVIVNGFTWSPNGQYIAFWADVRYSEDELQQDTYRLFVFDVAQQQITNYCIPGFYYRTPTPVWSPDSQQLLVYSYVDAETSRIILVDIVQDFAVQIEEGLSLIGWMMRDN